MQPLMSIRARGATDDERRVYAHIFEAIMAQRLIPGTKLPEVQLGSLFGVDRAVVRRALIRLAHDHVVELRPHRGAVVSTPDAQEAATIFEARRAIEQSVVRLAAGRATRPELTTIKQHLKAEKASIGRLEQREWAQLASNFHLKLLKVADNPILERYLTELLSRCSLIVARHEKPGNAACEHEEHRAIARFVEAGDAEAAAHAMEQHLIDLESRLTIENKRVQRDLASVLGLE